MPTHPIATQLVPVSQIHPNPDQPRKFIDPEEIQALKASIAERGLINPISVLERSPGDYMIIAGERRFKAVCELSWREIDARVWPSATSAEEAELLSMVENVQRTDLSPLEIANGYKALTQPPHNMTQEEIAHEVGKAQQTVGNYLTISQLDPKVQQFTDRSVKLGLAHLLQISRLKSIKEQIRMVEKVGLMDLSVFQLKALVDRKLGLSTFEKGVSKPRVLSSKLPQDPLADLWPPLAAGAIASVQPWGVSYGLKAIPWMKGVILPAWQFWIANNGPAPKDGLRQWFLMMAEAMGDTSQEKREASKAQESVARMTPLSAKDMERVKADEEHIRLPQTPQEEAELEAAARQSPGAMYAWIYGPDSVMGEKFKSMTWQDGGGGDPLVICREIVNALRSNGH